MIIYSALRADFSDSVLYQRIDEEIRENFKLNLGHSVSDSEFRSWKNSLPSINNALEIGDIPGDANVAIEYQIPRTTKRVDFMVAGKDKNQQDNVVFVELKQWEQVSRTDMRGIVKSYVGGGQRDLVHPSRQVLSYTTFIKDFNVEVQENEIELHPCAYLHNCKDPSVIKSDSYRAYLDRAPTFLGNEVDKLGEFLANRISFSSDQDLIKRMEESPLRPSKDLANCIDSLLHGNREFNLLDEQILALEKCKELAELVEDQKQVLLVRGGPGTGKSVVAINLLNELLNSQKICKYVTRNTAPNKVFRKKLSGRHSITEDRLRELFVGSGSFRDKSTNEEDVLLIDEAHRLNLKSGNHGQFGENQIMEIINAAKCSVFFLDEDQQVHWKDIGTREEIIRWAEHHGADLSELKLESQFRCNGSDGYLDWIDRSLQISRPAELIQEKLAYDFRVFDNPIELRAEIEEHNKTKDRARLVAGFCWEWQGKKDPSINDVTIPEYGFSMPWNLHENDSDSASYWIMRKGSINEVGCINTCQGLELDYVGVIIGKDLMVRNGVVQTDAGQRAKGDSTVRGYKTALKKDPTATLEKADRIIKNTYRTLMTRGTKGCYVFCVDSETNEYFKTLSNGVFKPGLQVLND